MRTPNKRQVLTTPMLNVNGVRILASAIDLSRYKKNPVLRYDPKHEGHNGVVVGQVIDIREEGETLTGQLTFMERYEVADIAYEKYTQGVLTHTSVGGPASGYMDGDIYVVEHFLMVENSLVYNPANIECDAIETRTVQSSAEKKFIKHATKEGREVRYLTMCADYLNINENKQGMEPNVLETVTQTVTASAETVTEPVTEPTPESVTQTVTASADPVTEPMPEPEPVTEPVVANVTIEPDPLQGIEPDKGATPEPEDVIADVTASVDQTLKQHVTTVEKAVTENTNASAGSPPEGMNWHERSQTTQIKFSDMNKTFKELTCDADFQKRMNALNAAYRTGAGKSDATPENADTLRALACSMLDDEKMVILASVTRMRDEITGMSKNGLQMLIECAAGPAASATLAAADLGVIKYLSIVYEQLFANDTFRRAVRFVPMSDRTGAIFIESGINVPISMGSRSPLNAPIYTYDDIKRTIERKVVHFDPVLFQHSDLAVLAYDKQSLGIRETMDAMMESVSTYWLQVFANTPGLITVGTTGDVVSTNGLFPIEAPNSNLNVHKPTLEDLVAVQGRFLMQNYNLGNKRIEMVLPANIYSMLAGDREVRDKLIRELNANIGSYINFSDTRVTPRNPVARYNTATPGFELDQSMYTDKLVADDGTLSNVTPAVTTANHIGAGLAFVENEVIAGIGAIELIVRPQPEGYGTLISGWMSTGATVARQNAKGVVGIVPTVETTTP